MEDKNKGKSFSKRYLSYIEWRRNKLAQEAKMENESKSRSFSKKYMPWLMVLIIAVTAFISGMCCSNLTSMTREDRLEDALELIRENHVGDYDEDELYYGAVKGAVESLNDPYTSFLTPEEARDYNKSTAGEMVGIGIRMSPDEQKQVRVIYVMPDGPAEKAGLKRGDIILKADGVELTGLPLDEVFPKIKGKENTQLKLTVQKTDSEQPVEVTITRRALVFPSVTCSVKNEKILYISVSQFNGLVMSGVYACAMRYDVENIKGIVLDLRDNPGGSLDTAIDLSSQWIPKDDVLVCTMKTRHEETQFMSTREHLFAGKKTVVLVNKGSASASEVVSGALQDYKVATVMGEQTHGKGVGQHITTFSDGSMLILVSFKWYTPLGRNIHQTGITPDIQMSVDPAKVGWDADPMLDKALEFFTR